jgi:squalene-hopene/tetraprenyl-beta-curcumene cyclase
MWLLWASTKLDGLLTPEAREGIVRDVLAKQRKDGGWNLPSLGDWKRLDDTPNDPNADSDGYATGLAIFVLRQAGVKADDKQLRRGCDWLKANQRASGRWFTRSLNNDNAHYNTAAGTAFAVMALRECGEK